MFNYIEVDSIMIGIRPLLHHTLPW